MKFIFPTFAACLAGSALAQQPGHQKQDATLPLPIQTCTKSNGCTTEQGTSVVLDSNWYWVHKVNDYTNCYEGTAWDATDCPDPKTCAQNCALDSGDASGYESTYGVSVEGNALNIKFVTNSNVGSRTYLMDTKTTYKMFKLKNQEFTFDVDASTLPCGLNGALYFVEMDADGGMDKYPGNKAGAFYGTGYCDAQCPHDIKFINGEANILEWNTTTAVGKYGTCCHEMDIWESNKISQAVTPHSCNAKGQTRCENPKDCGDGDDRQNGICDKDGCDLATYRLGETQFFGPNSTFTVDSSKKITVVTQFITSDNTVNGDLVDIKRFYVQNGKTIQSPQFTLGGKQFNSITDEFCAAQKKEFGDENTFSARGGLKSMGDALGRGMVLVMSLWDDHAVNMLWLDSDFPPTKPASAPGVSRGSCSTDSGVPAEVEKQNPNSYVKYSNIRVGDIGSTTPGAVPAPSSPAPSSPAPSSPAPSSPSPSGGNCPGGTLDKCMDLCPATPPAAFKACVADCVKRCT
jgi:cellulose 1,4-beta-cellobiosidase